MMLLAIIDEGPRCARNDKLFCDYDSEVAVDAVADVVEVFLFFEEDELIVGVGA